MPQYMGKGRPAKDLAFLRSCCHRGDDIGCHGNHGIVVVITGPQFLAVRECHAEKHQAQGEGK